jgi:hypothetical protein
MDPSFGICFFCSVFESINKFGVLVVSLFFPYFSFQQQHDDHEFKLRCTIKGNWRITGTDRFLPGFPGLGTEFLVGRVSYFKGLQTHIRWKSTLVVSSSGQGGSGSGSFLRSSHHSKPHLYNTHFDKRINLAFRILFAMADGTFTPSRIILSLGLVSQFVVVALSGCPTRSSSSPPYGSQGARRWMKWFLTWW